MDFRRAQIRIGEDAHEALAVISKLPGFNQFILVGEHLATGPPAVGRGFYNGAPTDWVSGSIDDVRAYSGVLPASGIRALAGNGSITVHENQAGPTLNSTQLGAFLEEINHSGDGGIYAELVRNRDLKESSSSPVYYSAVQDNGAAATIALDTSTPFNSANPVSLKLSVG